MNFFNFSILLVIVVLVTSNSTPTLYELLGVSEDATSDQIKKAFRKLSIKMHPDRNTDDPDAESKYLAVKRAYEVLIDVSHRNTYDLFGQEGLEEIQKRPKPKGGDYRPEMSVPLSKFYEGGQMTFSFRRGEICRHCKGSGDSDGIVHVCESCKGSGRMTRKVKVKDGYKQMQMKCKQCQGSGKAAKKLCPVCHGEKIVMKPRDLVFEVQKGMVDGDKVLFKGQSQQGLEFYPGDVIVSLKQESHSYLKRAKNNLEMNLEISLKQAILGFEKNIKQLDGRNIQIIGDYNLQDGEVIKVENQGMPVRGQPGQYGDLLAKVGIKYPKSYTAEQLQAIRAIFNAAPNMDEL